MERGVDWRLCDAARPVAGAARADRGADGAPLAAWTLRARGGGRPRTNAILSSSRQSFSVLTQLGGEFGVKGRVGALPARFGPRGIVETRVPELDTREQVRLQAALGG